MVREPFSKKWNVILSPQTLMGSHMEGSDPHTEGVLGSQIPSVLRDQSGCLERLGL